MEIAGQRHPTSRSASTTTLPAEYGFHVNEEGHFSMKMFARSQDILEIIES